MKFSSSQAGTISAIRFYKGSSNTGTHTAHLWTSTGTLLASATFPGETSSGWQQANFTSPVPISADVGYVASYHTPGNYSADSNYFSAARTVGPLTAPASGNRLYTYGTGVVFPSSTFSGSNYYVDVVFNSGGGGGALPPVANPDIGFSTPLNTAIGISAASLLANDTDPNGGTNTLSVTGATSGTGGWTIIAIHDSKESWERFRDTILMPKLKQGVTGGFENPPQETAFEVHNLMP